MLNLLSNLNYFFHLKKWLCLAGVIFERLQFRFNKLKELSWFDALMNQTKRDSMACFLHISPHLEILFVKVKIDQNLSSIPCPYFHQYWHEPHLWMDYETVTSHACQLEHLKLIQLEGFTNEEDDQLMMLMNLLLRQSVALKSMTVISPEKESRQVTKIPKSQLKQTSACNPKRIVISSPNEDYFFGLIEDRK
ncbi:hypothetical protein RHGRI_011648 [Rhododendron griersonianum]|uniref:FBD domain-containing protein n=1 Tax=Rhododendron griersonianum TaxID=479676 RepID=A0AAV6KMN3_9ERIC|nr:hypothetical protein RHGRI_011648 [Rhododendron griersonianum]